MLGLSFRPDANNTGLFESDSKDLDEAEVNIWKEHGDSGTILPALS